MAVLIKSSGCLIKRNEALLATAVLVRATGGRIHGWNIYNPSNASAFVHLYDAAAAADVTVGTTTPKMTIGAKTLDFNNAPVGEIGISGEDGFIHGIVMAATTTATTAGSSAPNVGVVVNLFHAP